MEQKIAGLGDRLIAVIVDGIIIAVFMVIVVGLTAVLVPGGMGEKSPAWVGALLGAVYLASPWIYFTLLEGLGGGRTLGKRLVGIRVVKLGGEPISFGQAAIRNLLRYLNTFLMVDYLVACTNEKRQRIGDFGAKTIVVKNT